MIRKPLGSPLVLDMGTAAGVGEGLRPWLGRSQDLKMNGRPKPFLLLLWDRGQGGQMQYPEEEPGSTTPIWVPPPKMSVLACCS